MSKKVFTNEECQVIVKAFYGLSRAVKVISEHIYDSYDDETFAHVVEPYKDCRAFAKATIFQLEKIQKRLQL